MPFLGAAGKPNFEPGPECIFPPPQVDEILNTIGILGPEGPKCPSSAPQAAQILKTTGQKAPKVLSFSAAGGENLEHLTIAFLGRKAPKCLPSFSAAGGENCEHHWRFGA